MKMRSKSHINNVVVNANVLGISSMMIGSLIIKPFLLSKMGQFKSFIERA
jgi:hypothetical protein